MLKPISILALDDVSAPLAAAVQRRIAQHCGLDDLAQARTLAAEADLAQAVQSIHAQRQRPDSPLRMRDDVSTRELVLLMLSAGGPARLRVMDVAREVRQLYERRRFASAFTIELICVLPEAAGTTEYAHAYGLLKALSATEPQPYDEVWLLDAVNANRVRFGAVAADEATYAEAIAGALLFEPEMSGALPGLHPRGMHPTFSTLGYARLVFPRDAALQRLEPRFASELIAGVLLSRASEQGVPASLRAKQFVAGESFAVPLSRIGVDAGQSLFKRFQAKTQVTEKTRSAEEVIAAARGELQAFRDGTHLANLERLARQQEETANELTSLVTSVTDETLDRESFAIASDVLEALIDPLPDLRADAEVSPRNLATSIRDATAALDARLPFAPENSGSAEMRARVRELDELLRDQAAVAEAIAPVDAEQRLEELRRERESVRQRLPERLFAEEAQNNAARNAARDAEAARLAAESVTREQQLRELFAQRPRFEQALREALEERRSWLWKQLLLGSAAAAAAAFINTIAAARVLQDGAIAAVILFALVAAFRYFTRIAPMVAAAREALARIVAQIETTDRAKNAAYNDELQFEYDVAHRRAVIQVLRRVRDFVKVSLDALRARTRELEELERSCAPESVTMHGLSFSIIEDADVDDWYERTRDDRKPDVREFPLRRSEARQLAMEVVRARITAHAAAAFEDFRNLTLAGAAATLATEARLAQCLKRFGATCAPLIELRDDDLPSQQAMQRDLTLWLDPADATWTAQLQRRLPGAHLKPSPDALSVHAVSRVLHYPGYVLGQIDYYRAEYEQAHLREFDDVADLMPTELAVSGPLRAAYEQVLLGRAVGVIQLRDGQLASEDVALGASHLAAAERLSAADAKELRTQLDAVLAPRLSIAGDVTRGLHTLLETSAALTSLDRGLIRALVARYTPEF